MKKLMTILLTVMMAFSVLTVNVLADTEVPETISEPTVDEIVEAVVEDKEEVLPEIEEASETNEDLVSIPVKKAVARAASNDVETVTYSKVTETDLSKLTGEYVIANVYKDPDTKKDTVKVMSVNSGELIAVDGEYVDDKNIRVSIGSTLFAIEQYKDDEEHYYLHNGDDYLFVPEGSTIINIGNDKNEVFSANPLTIKWKSGYAFYYEGMGWLADSDTYGYGNTYLFEVGHTHGNWEIGVNEYKDTIVATCGNEGCDDPAYSVSFSIKAPENLVYDGKPKEAILDQNDVKKFLSEVADEYKVEVSDIVYSSFEGLPLKEVPTLPGKYRAFVTVTYYSSHRVEENKAQLRIMVTYTISKIQSVVDYKRIEDVKYDGKVHSFGKNDVVVYDANKKPLKLNKDYTIDYYCRYTEDGEWKKTDKPVNAGEYVPVIQLNPQGIYYFDIDENGNYIYDCELDSFRIYPREITATIADRFIVPVYDKGRPVLDEYGNPTYHCTYDGNVYYPERIVFNGVLKGEATPKYEVNISPYEEPMKVDEAKKVQLLNAGVYTLEVLLTPDKNGNRNYCFSGSIETESNKRTAIRYYNDYKVTVEQAQASLSLGNNAEHIYDRKPQVIADSSITISYKDRYGRPQTVNGSNIVTVPKNKKVDAGNYSVDVSLDPEGNFYIDKRNPYRATLNYKILPALVELELDKDSFIYNGQVQKPNETVTILNGELKGQTLRRNAYTLTYANVIPGSEDRSIDVGDKTVTVSLNERGNYSNNFYFIVSREHVSAKTLGYTITPKQINLEWINAKSYVYDGEYHSPDLVITDAYGKPFKFYIRDLITTIQLDIPEDDEAPKTIEELNKYANANATKILTQVNAGKYRALGFIIGTGVGNYTFTGGDAGVIYDGLAVGTDVTFDIEPRELSVVWGDKVKFKYDKKEHAPEILDVIAINDDNDDTTGIVERDIDIVKVDYDSVDGKKVKPGTYEAKAVVYSKHSYTNPAGNYKIVENETKAFKIYRKPNEDTTPVKTGVDR